MKPEKALKKLLRGSVHARKTYALFLKWDEKLTVMENAEVLGLTKATVWNLVYKYRLVSHPCKIVKHRAFGYQQQRKSKAYYASKWNPLKTLAENAKALKLTTLYTGTIARRYNLPYLRKLKLYGNQQFIPNTKSTTEKKEKAKALNALGFNMRQIGSIIGSSRQRVHELLDNDK